jgi:Tol biopolymer transport system component
MCALALAALAAACGGTSSTTSDTQSASSASGMSSSAVASQGATPSPAAAGHTIAFARAAKAGSGDVGDIYVVGSDGGGLTRLTTSPEGEGPAAWSPDGSQIAYCRGEPFKAGVWVMDADGSGQRPVSGSKTVGPGLAWSPGAQIVFSNFEGPDVLALVAVNADGSGLTHVTPPGKPVTLDEQPAWGPDGRVYFDRETMDESEICSVGADGNRLTTLTSAPQPTSFSLSPDGRWLVLWDRAREALVRMPADGKGNDVVLVDKLSRYIPLLDAIASSWSPDGTMIAFAADITRFSSPSPLYVMNADGSDLREVPGAGMGWSPVWRPQ